MAVCADHENAKALQDELVPMDGDPVELRVETDGQEPFDEMWANAVWTGEGPPQVTSGA